MLKKEGKKGRKKGRKKTNTPNTIDKERHIQGIRRERKKKKKA